MIVTMKQFIFCLVLLLKLSFITLDEGRYFLQMIFSMICDILRDFVKRFISVFWSHFSEVIKCKLE